MNEITIYRQIKAKFRKAEKELKYGWWICTFWVFDTIISLFCLNMFPILMNLIIWIPVFGLIVYLFIAMVKVYSLAKKYPLIYNKWLSEWSFVDDVSLRASTRAQQDPNFIKIENHGLKYFDEVLNTYEGDKLKMANAIYNAITDTELVNEVNFYKKFKRFTKDINNYRSYV